MSPTHFVNFAEFTASMT